MCARPLAGICIAITRAIHQVDEQRRQLERHGAAVVHYPCIAMVEPVDVEPLDASIQRVISGEYDWIVLTSSNTIYALRERLRVRELSLASAEKIRVAAVGSATAKAASEQLGWSVELMPSEYTAASLGNSMPELSQSRVLLPQSAIAGDELAVMLRNQGATVDVVDAYRTVVATGGDPIPTMLWEGSIDAVTFTSGSTVRYFAQRLKREQASLSMLDDVCVACIGPSTAMAAQQLGLTISLVPDQHTIEGLTNSLLTYFGS